MASTLLRCSDARMRLLESERSEVIRIRLSKHAWAHFQRWQADAKREDPDCVLDGDTGTRQVLSAWVEEQIRETIDNA